ncbi:MAG: NAD(P)H-dependent oxidoreductase [Candidatus Dormibacteraeota bacterium]|nr:NAD(P)H-dependent oxidoreductase [Candidatus Dormibacteraeota bacterium]
MNESTNCFRILGISGSLRRGSYNTALLRTAAEVAPDGVEVSIFEGLRDIPPYDDDLRQEVPQPPVDKLKDAIRSADAVLFATPEYNHGVPGVLKNAIDWVSRPVPENPLLNKPTAIMGASGGLMGTVRAQQQLREVLQGFTPVLHTPEVLVSSAASRFDDQGALTDGPTREFVQTLVTNLVDWAEQLKPREKDEEEATG